MKFKINNVFRKKIIDNIGFKYYNKNRISN